ncbi:hypothetical protein HMPREF0972_01839 [Actinomyces sp. oral taxon 848 str. F0332]|nr:hypothetical protein HMPREF0972_01839 [Actinomyces sp. oral taxon 848 str. F0332]
MPPALFAPRLPRNRIRTQHQNGEQAPQSQLHKSGGGLSDYPGVFFLQFT